MNPRSLEDIAFQLMEQSRIEQLKTLKKTKIDYDSLLKVVPLEEIEKYLRKKKLQNIQKVTVHGIL